MALGSVPLFTPEELEIPNFRGFLFQHIPAAPSSKKIRFYNYLRTQFLPSRRYTRSNAGADSIVRIRRSNNVAVFFQSLLFHQNYFSGDAFEAAVAKSCFDLTPVYMRWLVDLILTARNCYREKSELEPPNYAAWLVDEWCQICSASNRSSRKLDDRDNPCRDWVAFRDAGGLQNLASRAVGSTIEIPLPAMSQHAPGTSRHIRFASNSADEVPLCDKTEVAAKVLHPVHKTTGKRKRSSLEELPQAKRRTDTVPTLEKPSPNHGITGNKTALDLPSSRFEEPNLQQKRQIVHHEEGLADLAGQMDLADDRLACQDLRVGDVESRQRKHDSRLDTVERLYAQILDRVTSLSDEVTSRARNRSTYIRDEVRSQWKSTSAEMVNDHRTLMLRLEEQEKHHRKHARRLKRHKESITDQRATLLKQNSKLEAQDARIQNLEQLLDNQNNEQRVQIAALEADVNRLKEALGASGQREARARNDLQEQGRLLQELRTDLINLKRNEAGLTAKESDRISEGRSPVRREPRRMTSQYYTNPDYFPPRNHRG